ncbi:uncharacterized protein arhgef5 isoform X2 [Gasterosteus aculeatus]
MGTKRLSWNPFETLSSKGKSDSKLQPGGKISRDPSPSPAMTAQSERERDSRREEDRRSERETLKMRDKARSKETDPRDRYYGRDRAPALRPREGEREWRERERRQGEDRSRNGRLLSNLEKLAMRDVESAAKKGDTFPKMRKRSADRGTGTPSNAEVDEEERGELRRRDGPRRAEPDDWERERERARRRERHRERERDEVRSRGKEEGKYTLGRPVIEEEFRKRERYRDGDDGFKGGTRERGHSLDRRDRDAGRKREKPRPNMGEREASVPSPHNPRLIYSDRNDRAVTPRGEGRRDIRSEGDSDERERKRERVKHKERQEWTYQHSRSEGDDAGRMQRERYQDRQGHWEEDRQRYRDGDREADRSRRNGAKKDEARYREVDRRIEREGGGLKERVTDLKYDKREGDSNRQHEQRTGREVKEGEGDLRRDDKIELRSRSETHPRGPPRVQSSGEWSSDVDCDVRYRRYRDGNEDRESGRDRTAGNDRDVERQRYTAAERSQREERRHERQDRVRGEMTARRRMWLEPQRGKNSKGEFVDTERHAMRKERRSSEGERSKESGGEWEREGRRVKEEPDEKHLDKSRYRGRQEGRNGQRGDGEREGLGVSVDGEEEVQREVEKGGIEHQSDGDGGTERGLERETDHTEGSDREEERGSRSENEGGGSETGWSHGRMPSAEDGFVTVSSGGDEEDEKEEEGEFEDCPEFWEGAPNGRSPVAVEGCEGDTERGTGKEEADDDEEEKEKQKKYVFCVIGKTSPRSEATETSLSQPDHTGGGVERGNLNKDIPNDCGEEAAQRPHRDLSGSDDCPIIIIQDTEINSGFDPPGEEWPATGETTREDVRHTVELRNKVEHPIAIKRDSRTEKLLTEWREKNRDGVEEEEEQTTPDLSNPYGDVCSRLDMKQIQPILEAINAAAMSPEEVEAIRIRMSGTWSMSEEPKRHSQAPHLKWANNVVREILGPSEQNTVAEPPIKNDNGRQQEAAEAPVSKVGTGERHSEPQLEEEEPLEAEGLRDDDEDDKSKSWGEVELRNVLDTIDRRKRNSRFFNTAQLYQQYSEAAQNIEIKRQARSDVVSVYGDSIPSPSPSPPPACRPLPPIPPVPHPHSLLQVGPVTSVRNLPLPEPPKSESRPPSPRLSISLSQSATLWRELPGVQDSAELEKLTDDQRRLQEVRFEVVTSEASYCRSLDIVVEHFVQSKPLGALLTTQERNWLFSRLADVRAISHSFLSKLEERVETDIMQFTVCDIIARHCQRFKMVYVPYLTNQSYQDATYQRLMNENPGFRRNVERLERSPVCQRLPLRSFLVLPFQRITRIKLLVQNIVKRTTPGTAAATQAIKSLKLLEKLIQQSNDSITEMKSIESLVSLNAKVDFEGRTLPLISQSRRLVREGPLTELMDNCQKETERSVYLHLFNDYLLLSLLKEGGRFTVIDHCPVSDVRAENFGFKLHSLQKNLFRLHMTHRSPVLRTDTQSDKLRWMSALSRKNPEIDFLGVKDLPQMQCIRAIVSQQPDELSLEKADIIQVHQQSSDHWVQGIRLSDRHHGWVPESHLETITNPKVRQRNLEDALKLTTATAAV